MDANAKVKALLKALDRSIPPATDPAPQPSTIADCIGELATGHVDPVLAAALLVALRVSRIDRDPAVIAAAAAVMRSKALQIEHDVSAWGEGFVDIVGTGGDGKNTFNISTTAAIVAAGAGLPVCKHGNRAASSASGSADILMSMGANLAAVHPESLASVLHESRFCFLFAQVFHPGMRHVAPVRKSIGLPSIFNYLGPLTNPARLKARVVGVASRDMGDIFAQALHYLKSPRAVVVCGAEGLDEVSIAGPTHVWRVSESGNVQETTIEPADFGLASHALSEAASGTPEENARTLEALLSGKLQVGNAVLDFVLVNAATLLHTAGLAADWKEGVQLALKAIESGAARRELDAFINATTKA